MKIYTLTELGYRLARNTSNPDTPAWRVVHYLDSVGHSTTDQIAGYTGLSEGEVGSAISKLKRTNPPIVQEVGGSQREF